MFFMMIGLFGPGAASAAGPLADTGPDQTAIAGQTVQLDGGAASTDPDGDPLSFAWTLSSKPGGSSASLPSSTSVSPSLVVDLPGTYVAELTVYQQRRLLLRCGWRR